MRRANEWDLIIDCSQEFEPDIDVERKNDTTGELEVYAGITGISMHLSATKHGPAIHAALTMVASERSGYPGRIYATYGPDILQQHLLPTYDRQIVWLVLTDGLGIDDKSIPCLVTTNGE